MTSIGEIGRNTFREVMGISASQTQINPELRIEDLSYQLQRLKTLGTIPVYGMTRERLQLLQDNILDFANFALDSKHLLNNEKKDLWKQIRLKGRNAKTFEGLKNYSKKHIDTQKMVAHARSFIDQMNDYLYQVIEHTIDDITPETVIEDIENITQQTEALSNFNERAGSIIESHLTKIDDVILKENDLSNELIYAQQDLDAMKDERHTKYMHQQELIIDKLSQKVSQFENQSK